MLPDPSEEQSFAISSLKNGNVILDSIAGSGKSTTCIHIAKTYTNKNILVLTYSQKLKEEMRTRVTSLGVENLSVHSFHSFANQYYTPCPTDEGLVHLINNSLQPKTNFGFSIIIIDEVQDMKDLLYKLVYKIYYDNRKTAKLCIIGDRNQCIFQFNSADERYLLLADQVFNFNTKPWTKCALSTSWRFSIETADAINWTMMGYKRLTAAKLIGYKPKYYCCNLFCKDQDENEPFQIIKDLLAKGANFDDIFVLSYSVKQSRLLKEKCERPINILANMLVHDNIPVFVPSSDDQIVNKQVILGKIAFLSFHQCKGLETKHVLIIGFDNFYLDKILKWEVSTCPNELYVATTRHKENLFVFQNARSGAPNFMNQDLLTTYWEVHNFRRGPVIKHKETQKTQIWVTELLDYVKQEVVEKCMKLLKITKEKRAVEYIKIDTVVKQKWGYEDVSGLLGVAIPAYFEQMLKSKTTIHEYIKNIVGGDTIEDFTAKDVGALNLDTVVSLQPKKIKDIVKIAIKWYCISTGFLVKNNQIVNLNLVSKEQMAMALGYLNELKISRKSQFEKRETRKYEVKTLIGRVDCIDGDTIYEFKCCPDSFKHEHVLQVALYVWIFNNKKKGLLFNILSGELWRVEGTDENLFECVKLLMEAKFNKKYIQTDDQFLEYTYLLKKYVDDCEDGVVPEKIVTTCDTDDFEEGDTDILGDCGTDDFEEGGTDILGDCGTDILDGRL